MSNKKIYLFTFAVIIIAVTICYLWIQKYPRIPTPPTTPNIVDTASSTAVMLPFDPVLQNAEVLSFPDNTIDTSDWQTYRNEELGFEVKYPNGWKLVWDDNTVNGGNNYFGVITLSPPGAVFDGPMIVNIPIYRTSIESVTRDLSERGWNVKKNIIVNNLYGAVIDSKNIENSWNNRDSYYIEHRSYIFIFDNIGQNEITQKILLSFRPIK